MYYMGKKTNFPHIGHANQCDMAIMLHCLTAVQEAAALKWQ